MDMRHVQRMSAPRILAAITLLSVPSKSRLLVASPSSQPVVQDPVRNQSLSIPDQFSNNAQLIAIDPICANDTIATFVRIARAHNNAVATLAVSLSLDAGTGTCFGRPYAFDVVPNASLENHAKRSQAVHAVHECLVLCLEESNFPCHSVNFVKDEGLCVLNGIGRRSAAPEQFTASQNVDYFENNCLTEESRCALGKMHFVRAVASQIPGKDVSLHKQTLASCLSRCLSASAVFCRAVEFSANTSDCSVSDEDFATDVRLLESAAESGLDVYEPICLPYVVSGGGVRRAGECGAAYTFERTADAALVTDNHRYSPLLLAQAPGLAVQQCLAECLSRNYCTAVNYVRHNGRCELLDAWAIDETKLNFVRVEGVDHYVVMCPNRPREDGGIDRSQQLRMAPESDNKDLSTVQTSRQARDLPMKPMKKSGGMVKINEKPPPILSILSRAERKATTSQKTPVEGTENVGDIGGKGSKMANNVPEERLNKALLLDDAGPVIKATRVSSSSNSQPVELNQHGYKQRFSGHDFDSEHVRTTRRRMCRYDLKALHRQLKPFYRNDHHNIGSLTSCQTLCATWPDFVCRSASFSPSQSICSLSQLDLNDYPIEDLTVPMEGFGFYVRSGCQPTPLADFSDDLPVKQIDVDVSPRYMGTNSVGNSRLPWPELVRALKTFAANGNIDGVLTPLANSDPTTVDGNPLEPRGLDNFEETPPTVATDGQTTFIDDIDLYGNVPESENALAVQDITGGESAEIQSPIESVNENSVDKSDSSIDFTPARSVSGAGVDVDNILLSAVCTKNGVNVTVTLNEQRYTGAIYASERYSTCRSLVNGESIFSLFLYRPSVDTACNTLEAENVLSAVVIISNDAVLPYDVTTKDDLFYEVSCDYSQSEGLSDLRDGILVKGGIVVGGPTPRVVAASGNSASSSLRNLEVVMRILRSGRPVQNVLLGEQLTMAISSSLPAVRMHVDSCNVTRVGGAEPSPQALQLMKDGCPIVPSVLPSCGPEGALTTESMQTSSALVGTALARPARQLSSDDTSLPQPLGLHAQGVHKVAPPSEGQGGTVEEGTGAGDSPAAALTADGILRVYVPGENGAPNVQHDDVAGAIPPFSSTPSAPPSNCISTSIFFAVSGTLITLLAVTTCACLCLLHGKKVLSMGTLSTLGIGGYVEGKSWQEERCRDMDDASMVSSVYRGTHSSRSSAGRSKISSRSK